MPASFRDDLPLHRARLWRYVEPGEHGEVAVTLSEAEIVRRYFDFYAEGMRRVGKAAEISEQGCIDDWVTVHWAEQVPV